MLKSHHTSLFLAGTLLGTLPAFAQWTTTTLNLHSGWNAIFLELEPEPRDCDTVFRNTAVESVWTWNRRFTTDQYITNVNDLVVGQPDWLAYVPTNNSARSLVNLYFLEGGRPYLIKVRTGSSVNLPIIGKPFIRRLEWLADSLNLVGFPLAPSGSSPEPRFLNCFAGS